MTMKSGTIKTPDGRTIGFADDGRLGATPVLWCHGGPGTRLEGSWVSDAAAAAGLRVLGIDRPGYGLSTPQPGRTIGGWVSDALAVLDYLGVDRFLTIGCSTGGAYALALGSQSSRALGVVACCAISDMRWAEGKAMNVGCHPVWNAHSRDEALEIGRGILGDGGENLVPQNIVPSDPADARLLATPEFRAWWGDAVPEMVTFGPTGYVDDRLADGGGWTTFDVGRITCPVMVLHGETDGLAPVRNAYHTAAIVPRATLRLVPDCGHFSAFNQTVRALSDLRAMSMSRFDDQYSEMTLRGRS